MAVLSQGLRSLTPTAIRDDPRVRSAAVGLGLVPPRRMHSAQDMAVLLNAARDARRVVEIGVYEGGSAKLLCETLDASCELHLVDPFGAHPDALPGGWGGTEWATRRVIDRVVRRRGRDAPAVRWHVALSHDVAASWSGSIDLVFIDGDHSEAGCELDWVGWNGFVALGGHVVFHDARAGEPGGRGLPGPSAVARRYFRDRTSDGWRIAAESDRTVAVQRV